MASDAVEMLPCFPSMLLIQESRMHPLCSKAVVILQEAYDIQ